MREGERQQIIRRDSDGGVVESEGRCRRVRNDCQLTSLGANHQIHVEGARIRRVVVVQVLKGLNVNVKKVSRRGVGRKENVREVEAGGSDAPSAG
jgi:hypothetical protein